MTPPSFIDGELDLTYRQVLSSEEKQIEIQRREMALIAVDIQMIRLSVQTHSQIRLCPLHIKFTY